MDDDYGLPPEVKGWLLIVAGVLIVTWFACMWARTLIYRIDPSDPDKEDDRRLRRAMHAASGATVEQEIEDELEHEPTPFPNLRR